MTTLFDLTEDDFEMAPLPVGLLVPVNRALEALGARRISSTIAPVRVSYQPENHGA